MLQKSVISRSGNNGCRMHWRWFIRHLELSSQSGNHRAVLRSPVLKLKVGTSKICFKFQEVLSLNQCFRHPVHTLYFFLYFGVDSPTVGLAIHFPFTVCKNYRKILIFYIFYDMPFHSPILIKITFAQQLYMETSVKRSSQIGQETWKVRVLFYLSYEVRYERQWVDFLETHACYTMFGKEFLYWYHKHAT
jgi:hypothetical protein